MAYLLIYLYKAPRVLPLGIVEIIHRLLSKCILLVTGATEIDTCGNLNLCSVLGSVIKGDLHATLVKYSNP